MRTVDLTQAACAAQDPARTARLTRHLKARLEDFGPGGPEVVDADQGAGTVTARFPGHDTAQVLRELEQAGLIRRVTPRRGEASQIFLSLPEDAFSAGGGPKSRPAPGRKTSRDPAKKPAPNDLREQRNLNDHSYVYGEGESV